MLLGLITLKSEKILYEFDSDKLEEVLHFGKTLSDRCKIGKMKDFYVFYLFNFKNILILFENDLFYEFLYMFSYTCGAESVINLTRQSRIKLLQIAFDILYGFLIKNLYVKRGQGITIINNCQSSKALIFSDDCSLIRTMSSIIRQACVLKKYENVAMDRIGTYLINNFFFVRSHHVGDFKWCIKKRN